MKTRTIVIAAAAFVLLSQLSTNLHANPDDDEIELDPALEFPDTDYPGSLSEQPKNEKCVNADGSPKKIHVSYKVTQDTDTSPIHIDASSSTVPSGDISYRWNPNKPSAGFKPVYTLEDSVKGYSRTTQLQILDLTCHIHLVTSFEVYSK